MFIDEATISVAAGDGGNGCYAYERSRGRSSGEPSGGSGGRGGNVYVEGSAQLHTLQDVSYRRHYRAKRGAHGKGSNRTGRAGDDVAVMVPLGTIATDVRTGRLLFDCVNDRQRHVVAHGGRGGKGNAALVSRANPNPAHALPGKRGETREIHVTLKVLADIGLVGRPNAGKSTFLSRISMARPKIADYPFTTTQPHLGIVSANDTFSTMVVADIPGLIEDSHKGKGLGARFLRHIERTSILAVMVEADSEDPGKDAAALLNELRAYSPVLAAKPTCFILSKTDLCAGPPPVPEGWLGMSAVTGKGVSQVLDKLRGMFSSVPEKP